MHAVHFEVCQSLDIDLFMMIPVGFISRIGMPSEIFTENGTNFVRVQCELRNLIENWSAGRISDKLSQREV